MIFTSKNHKNPLDLSAAEKYYPAPVYLQTTDLSNLASEIAHSTSLTATDVKAVIEELLVSFKRHLLSGEKIKLDGIGIFKVSFSGTGTETPEEVTSKNIDPSTIRVTFVSDLKLKKAIRSEITFEKYNGR